VRPKGTKQSRKNPKQKTRILQEHQGHQVRGQANPQPSLSNRVVDGGSELVTYKEIHNCCKREDDRTSKAESEAEEKAEDYHQACADPEPSNCVDQAQAYAKEKDEFNRSES
jgi:hypothetical protein